MNDETWSPMIGLRRVFITLLFKSVICLIGWTAVAWLIIPPLAWISRTMAFGFMAIAGMIILVAGVMPIPAAAIGGMLSKRLNDRAGFDGPVLTVLASLFAWAAIVGGTAIALQLRPDGSWLLNLATFLVGGIAMLFIAKNTWLDPE
jgi:hypothetical protein